MKDVNLLNMEEIKPTPEEKVERINPQNIPPNSIGERELDSTFLADYLTETSINTVTNKTLTAPTITSPTTTGTDSGTETLENKTLTSPVITTPTIKTWDGWQSVTDTWTYASASTITVPAGAASLYRVGDKIKLTNTTLKYFVITAVADTLLTVAVNTDYVVANAAISGISISHMETPIGFPHSFAYTATLTGFSSNPTVTSRFSVTGRTCTIFHNTAGGGTSNATGFTVSTPITSGANAAAAPMGCLAVDNSVETIAMVYIAAASSTIVLAKGATLSAASWTASNNKYAYFTFTYEI